MKKLNSTALSNKYRYLLELAVALILTISILSVLALSLGGSVNFEGWGVQIHIEAPRHLDK